MRYSICATGPVVSAASCALPIFEAATICIALVICAVPVTDLMRRRMSRALGMGQRARCSLPELFEFVDAGLQLSLQRVAERLFLLDLGQERGLPRGEEFRELRLK